jgi:hypothetical protein
VRDPNKHTTEFVMGALHSMDARLGGVLCVHVMNTVLCVKKNNEKEKQAKYFQLMICL